MDTPQAKNDLDHDDSLRRMDEDTAIERIFQTANQVVTTNDSIKTPVNIKFSAEKRGAAINLPQKHAKLLEEMQHIDPTATFTDGKGILYEDPATILNCKNYDTQFDIDATLRQEGHLYVKCILTSKIKVNKFKHGEKNLMTFLTAQKMFISHRRFDHATEAKVGFFLNINPDTYSRTDLRNQLSQALKEIPLNDEEKELLTKDENGEYQPVIKIPAMN